MTYCDSMFHANFSENAVLQELLSFELADEDFSLCEEEDAGAVAGHHDTMKHHRKHHLAAKATLC